MIAGIVANKLRASVSSGAGDPFYDLVVANLHFDGADGSTIFTDEKGHTFTAAGAAQIDTAQSVFGGSSLLLDGTNDFVTSPDHADWSFAAENFTIDCWVRFNGDPGTAGMTFVSHWEAYTSNQRGWIFGLNNNTLRFVYSTNGSNATILSAAWNPASATWYYVSVVRYGPTLYFFVDGVLLGTGNIGTATIFDANTTLQIGTQSNGADFDMNGWIDDVRITKAARYTTSFSRPWRAHYDTAATLSDELYSRVVSSLHFNNNLTDQKGITWTAAGNASVDNTQSVFGGYSLRVDGTGDWLDASNADFAWGTGDFTIEAWVRFNSRSGNNFVFTFGGGWGVYTSNNQWAVFDGDVTDVIGPAGTVANNVWYHVALCRSGTSLRLFVDGVQVGSTSTNSTNFSDQAIRLGAQPSGSGTMNGWIDDFRATNAARYVGSFQFPLLQNADRAGDRYFDAVQALLHFDTDMLDIKGHEFQAAGLMAISSDKYKFGGSSLRDSGSSTYLHGITNTDFGIGTNDYTIEFWVNGDAWTSTRALFDMRPFGSGGAGPMCVAVGTELRVYLNSGYRVQAGTLVADTWHHIAITRASAVSRVFLDGVQIGSNYTDNANYPASQPLIIGRFSDSLSYVFTGYFDEFRFTKGVARYTSNFAPLPIAFPDSL